jgi:hypothetical protein
MTFLADSIGKSDKSKKEQNMNALELHCVSISPKVQQFLEKGGDTSKQATIHTSMDLLVRKLHLDNPNWQFEFTDTNWQKQLTSFRVIQDGEELGTVAHAYIGGRAGTGFRVSNERIAEKLSRGNSYNTKDVDKAYLKIKKMFSKQSVEEVVAKARELAENEIDKHYVQRHRARDEATRILRMNALNYVMEGGGYELFFKYIQEQASADVRNNVNTAIEKQRMMDTEMATIDQVRNKIGKEDTALIIRNSGEYVFRHGTDTRVYNDQTLPESVRGKLGMLKLVEKEHYVENAGCRVSDDVFVIVMEKKDE